MPYSYLVKDDHASVVAGASLITYGGVVQADDGFGGYNLLFGSKEGNYFHVHMLGVSQVSVVRFFALGAGQGSNIIKHNGADKQKNFNGLANECGGFPNHVQMLLNFKASLEGKPTGPNGRYL